MVNQEQKIIEDSRKKYQKDASREASGSSGFIDKLRGIGVTAEDITKIDADIENELRDIKATRPELKDHFVEQLEMLHKSMLLIKDRPIIMHNGETSPTYDVRQLVGEINGKKINIKFHFKRTKKETPNVIQNWEDVKRPGEGSEYEGTIDGEKISKEDAKQIAYKYGYIAEERTSAIQHLIDEKREEADKPKRKKETEKAATRSANEAEEEALDKEKMANLLKGII